MRDTKFTPGPWRVDLDAGRTVGRCIRACVDGLETCIAIAEPIGSRYWHGGYSAHEIRHANAHLIAAAPDIYAALLELLAVLEGPLDMGARAARLGSAEGSARFALAKARGES